MKRPKPQQMQFDILRVAAEEMGISPYGAVIGFAVSLIALLVVNGNGLSASKIMLGVSSAMLVGGITFYYLATVITARPVVTALTVYASLIAPDIITFLKGTGPTASKQLFQWSKGVAVRWLTGLLRAFLPTDPKEPTDTDDKNPPLR